MTDTKLCGAILSIADDHGDNTATMSCQLPEGHGCRHRNEYSSHSGGNVTVEWEKDERVNCGVCGKLRKDYVRCMHKGCDKLLCEECAEVQLSDGVWYDKLRCKEHMHEQEKKDDDKGEDSTPTACRGVHEEGQAGSSNQADNAGQEDQASQG